MRGRPRLIPVDWKTVNDLPLYYDRPIRLFDTSDPRWEDLCPTPPSISHTGGTAVNMLCLQDSTPALTMQKGKENA